MKKYIIILLAAGLFFSCGDNGGDDGGSSTDNATISLSAEELTFNLEGNAQVSAVTVTSSGDWRVTGREDWSKPSAEKGQSGTSVTFTVEPNDTEEDREVTYTFFTGNAAKKLIIRQSAGAIVEYLSTLQPSYNVSYNGQYITLRINTNQDLSYDISEGDETWISVLQVPTRAETWPQIVVAPNYDYTAREGSITFFKGTEYEKEVNFIQAKRNIIIPDKAEYSTETAPAQITVKVNANIAYTVNIPSSVSSWLSLEGQTEPIPSETPGLNEVTYTFHVAQIPVSAQATVNLTSSSDTSASKSIIIKYSNPSAELFSIPDAVFAGRLVSLGYIVANGEKYELTYPGYTATSITITGSSYVNMESIEGIEKFVNLTTLRVEDCKLKKADVSRNTKITSLNLSYIPMEDLILGDINITTYTNNYMYAYNANTVRSQSFKASSSKLTTITINNTTTAAYDEIEWVDITGCPALKTLNCNRNNKKLKEIRVTQAQKDAYEAGTLTIVTNASFDKTKGIVVK